MPKICYEEKEFADWKRKLIQQAIGIVNDYKAQGYDLTLRQVYYQFVARDWLPQRWADKVTGSTNNQRSYKNLGTLLGDARMAGLMDWEAMVDRTREMGGNNHWTSPESIIDAVAEQYMIDKWQGQKYRPEVWVEKDALEGVVGRVARRLDVPFFSCRGYTSLTSIWENAQRLAVLAKSGANPVILHLGDHDPSGIDMSRDIEDRVRQFMGSRGHTLRFERLALNMDQIEQYNPPENPAKSTDSRFASYAAEHGESSWELDALDPKVIDQIITDAVLGLRDEAKFSERAKREATEKATLQEVSNRWEEVTDFIGDVEIPEDNTDEESEEDED